MATTTNFNWETPDDTDLVKDGASAIRTLGSSIDTSFVDLKGGTTGQVLSKASGTDLDFTWVAQDDSNAIQNAIVDAKGDLIAATAADTPARLAVGTNGQFLTADSTAATGLTWTTPSSSSLSWVAVGTVSPTSGTTATISGFSGYNTLALYFEGLSTNGTSSAVYTVRFNSDSGSNYYVYGLDFAGTVIDNTGGARTSIQLGTQGNQATNTLDGFMMVEGALGTTANKTGSTLAMGGGSTGRTGRATGFRYAGTSAITSVTVTISADTFDAGTVRLLGSVA